MMQKNKSEVERLNLFGNCLQDQKHTYPFRSTGKMPQRGYSQKTSYGQVDGVREDGNNLKLNHSVYVSLNERNDENGIERTEMIKDVICKQPQSTTSGVQD